VTNRGFRWLFVAAAVGLIGLPVVLGGLYVSGDLCEPPYGEGDRRLTGERYENVVETLVVRCVASYPGGREVEETRVNWLGGGAALAVLVGTFFGAAGLAGVIRRRPAAITTASCALVCLVLVAIWFV
jgi:hypothetical protein